MTPPPPSCLSKIPGFNSGCLVGFGGDSASEDGFRVIVGVATERVGRDGGNSCNDGGDSGGGGS